MDTNVAGLNKVYCFANSSSYNGRAVEITDGINTWTNTISELSCVFMIPSMPAPAKRTYTVKMYNSDQSAVAYTRNIELGFGDSVRIGLYEDDEPVTKGTVPLATNSRTGGVRINNTTSNGIYLDGNYVTLKTATSSQKGGIMVSENSSYGLYMSGDYLRTKYASASQAGCIKIGDGLQISSGVASLKNATSFQKGGVTVLDSTLYGTYVNGNGELKTYTADETQAGCVKIGTGISVAPDGTISIETARDYADFNVESSTTINANTVSGSEKIICTDSNVVSHFKDHGAVVTEIDISINSTRYLAFPYLTVKNSNSIELYVHILNHKSSSITISPTNDFSVHYFYFK